MRATAFWAGVSFKSSMIIGMIIWRPGATVYLADWFSRCRAIKIPALVSQARSFRKRLIRIRQALAMLGMLSKQPWRSWFFLLPWRRQIWETILSAASKLYLAPALKRMVCRMVNGALRFFFPLALVVVGSRRFVWVVCWSCFSCSFFCRSR